MEADDISLREKTWLICWRGSENVRLRVLSALTSALPLSLLVATSVTCLLEIYFKLS